MSLKLTVKTALFQILDILPEKWGFSCYHLIQEKLTEHSLQAKIRASFGTFHAFLTILQKSGIHLEGKSILEIGSGWLPLMPYYFKYLGEASKVTTVDLYKHYKADTIKELNRYFAKEYSIKIEGRGKYSLPQEVIYCPNTNFLNMQNVETDLVFSRFVLEHVHPEDIWKMHKKIKTSLKKGSYIIHFISPSDHRAYEDKTLSLQDFLQYSEEQWNRKQTKFDYHNRMRMPQYLELFRKAGLEVTYLNYEVPNKKSPTYKKFKKILLHPDYQKYSQEELMAGSIQVVLKV